jgi:hypothetical protein
LEPKDFFEMKKPSRTRTETPDCPKCHRCGEAMRLFGIEPHPVVAQTMLRTYVCEHCDAVQTAMAPKKYRTGAYKPRTASAAILLLPAKVFDDETTSRLGKAYEAAWQKLTASANPLADKSRAASTRELLAKCIIEMGRRGETDPGRLAEIALARLEGSNPP